MNEDLQLVQQSLRQASNDDELVRLWLRTKRSQKTRAEYKRDVARFYQWQIGARRFETDSPVFPFVRLSDLQDYAETLMNNRINTQRRMLASLKSLLTFAKNVGYLSFDVGAALPLPKAKDCLSERICTEQDILTMIVQEPHARNTLLLRLLYVSAARISEVSILRWRDLQARLDGGQVTLFGKGGKTRVVRLPAKLWDDLEAVRQGDDDFVFPSKRKPNCQLTVVQLWRIVKAAAKRAGLKEGISPHWLRHAHASHALERGANIKIVQETLGHESLQTTSRYTHARPDDSSAMYLGIT